MRTPKLVLPIFVLASLMLLIVTSEGQAGGFYVPQKGAAGIGDVNAGSAARSNDGSTVYFNPAGMTQLEGVLVQGGIDLIMPSVAIKNTGATATTPGTLGEALAYPGNNSDVGEPIPILNLYGVFSVPRTALWLGLALTAPFGLSLEYDQDWFGRYDSIKSKLVTIDIAPSFAYKIDNSWSIGGGLDIQYADAELTNAVPNTLVPGGPTPMTDGLAKLTGTAWSLGFNLGILWRAPFGTRIGLHYRSGIGHTLKGDAIIAGLQGPLMAANGRFGTSANLDLPPIVSFGITHNVIPSLTLLGEVQWFGWNTFDEIRIKFDNGAPTAVRPQEFRNTYAVALGVEYRGLQHWTLRAGGRYEQTPTVDRFRNTSIPDSNLTWLGLGAAFNFSERLIIDAGYTHVFFAAADIDLTQEFFSGTPASGTVNIKGRTNNHVNTIAMAVRYQF